jgi:phosphoribosylanthranilate isomerase
MFRIKICGITRPDDAALAARAGADAIGINFYAGSKRFVEAELAKKIAAAVPDSVAKVGVFVNASAAEIRNLAAEVPLDFVQLHGDEPPEIFGELYDLQVIKAFRCRDSGFVNVVRFLSQTAANERPRAVLVDAYHHAEYGGTGVALDWTEVGRQKEMLGDMPIVLAGGLNPDNVARAIRLARPQGVDTASGVESSPGVKDAAKVEAFIQNATRAYDEI